MTRDWPCFSSSRWVSARLFPFPRDPELEREALAEVDAAHILVADNVLGCTLHQHLAVMNDVSAVDDLERFAHIVVRDEDADAAVLQMLHQLANVVDGNGI